MAESSGEDANRQERKRKKAIFLSSTGCHRLQPSSQFLQKMELGGEKEGKRNNKEEQSLGKEIKLT